MEKGRSKSFSRTFKKHKHPHKDPAHKVKKKARPNSSHKKSLQKSRRSKEKTPKRKSKQQQEFSPSINNTHNESDQKGLISKTLNSNRKFKHNNQDYVKFLDVGKQFLRDGLYSSALDCLQRAILLQPHELEAHYLLGVTLLVSQQLEQAQQCFIQLVQHPQPKKNVFLLLAVCLKKQGKCEHLQAILSDCLQKYPKYYEAYAYRAKIRIKAKLFQAALQDFDAAIKLCPTNPMGYIGKGDTLRLMGKQEQALEYFKKVENKHPSQSLILKQALCRLELEQFGDAMVLVEQALSQSPRNSQTLFLKGLIYQRNKQFNLAVTYYEQAILEFTNKKAVAKSFYQIIKINIEERDYYEAVKTAERVALYNIQEKTLSKFTFFLDGVYLLRKKEIPAALAHFEQFQSRFKPGQFLKPLMANFRACAYLILGEYQEALGCLSFLESEHYLDSQSHYNMLICSGIIAANHYKYEQAVTCFASAMNKSPTRHEPAFYMAMTLMKYSCRHFANSDVDKKQKYQKAAFNYIEKALKIAPQNHSLLYNRAVFLFHQGDLPAALKDTSKSFKVASTLEHPVTKILYLRGLLHAALNNISKAIEDFTVVLSEDRKKEFPEAHLNRAKCLLFYGDKEAALADLQTYISNNPSDPAIHQWTGIVFYHFKSYEQSIRAYSNTINIKKNLQVLRLRADAYMATKQIKSCIDDLKIMKALDTPDKSLQTEFDMLMLEAIKTSLVSDQSHFERAFEMLQQARQVHTHGHYFSAKDISFYEGVFLFFLGDLQTACEYIQKAKKKRHERIPAEENRHAQICYNLALCLILKKQYEAAMKNLDEAAAILTGRNRQQVRFLHSRVSIVHQGNHKQTKKPSKDLEQYQINIFPHSNKLCNVYPVIPLQLTDCFLTKFSFCLPVPEPVTISPQFEHGKLFETMSPANVEPVPELPWVNKSRDGIVTFTDEILPDAMEIVFTEEEDEEEAYGEEDEDEMNMMNEGHLASSNQLAEAQLEVPPRQDIKNFLRLDDTVNDRLNKLFGQ